MWMQKVRQKTKEWPIILPREGKRNRQIETNQKTKCTNRRKMRTNMDRQNEATSYLKIE